MCKKVLKLFLSSSSPFAIHLSDMRHICCVQYISLWKFCRNPLNHVVSGGFKNTWPVRSTYLRTMTWCPTEMRRLMSRFTMQLCASLVDTILAPLAHCMYSSSFTQVSLTKKSVCTPPDVFATTLAYTPV